MNLFEWFSAIVLFVIVLAIIADWFERRQKRKRLELIMTYVAMTEVSFEEAEKVIDRALK